MKAVSHWQLPLQSVYCHSGCAVAWLTIDSDDDEATRFLFYLSQAVHRACPDVGAAAIELILENNLIDPPAVLSSLINDLTEVEEDVYFFFEDYHWLSAARIHQTVAYFLRSEEHTSELQSL